jgi:hypothetical protein
MPAVDDLRAADLDETMSDKADAAGGGGRGGGRGGGKRQHDDDDDEPRHRSCLPPRISMIERKLRAMMPDADAENTVEGWCFLCDAKDNEHAETLRKFIEAKRGIMEDVSIAIEVSKRYTADVRSEMDRHLLAKFGMTDEERAAARMPAWPPLAVWEHLQRHNIASIKMTLTMDIAQLISHHVRHGLYYVRRSSEGVDPDLLTEDDILVDAKVQAHIEHAAKIFDTLSKTTTAPVGGKGGAQHGGTGKRAVAGAGGLINLGAATGTPGGGASKNASSASKGTTLTKTDFI